MSKLNKILLVAVIILFIALGIVLYWQLDGFKQSYWAVYLNTGDLYFGQLNRFPTLSLSDVWFIQRNAQDTANPFTLVKFEQAFWKPENKIYLSEKDIVWKAKLQDDSPILDTIKNSAAAQNQVQSSGQIPNGKATTTPQ